MAGLDPVVGFVKRPIDDIKTQIEQNLIDEVSPSLDVSSSSPAGQLIGAVLKPIQELWDLAQAEYVAIDPDRNSGDAQDAVCAITGTLRGVATHSQAKSVTVTLTAGTTLITGTTLAAVQGNPNAIFRFRGVEPTGGNPVVNANFTAPSSGNFSVRFESVDTGPVAANAATLTVIVTPISGWTVVTNPTDAILGLNIETDSDLRVKREQELAALGSTPLDALRAELVTLLADNGIVGSVSAFENDLDTVDADGRPGHSVEALVNDNSLLSNNAIAQVIWNGKAGGIQTFGSTTGTATDALGLPRTMNFNRPTLKPVYFAVSFTVTPNFPADGDAQIKAAMVLSGQTGRNVGDDVMQNRFFGPIYTVAGVGEVTILNLGFSASPVTSTDLVIALRELATFDTGRISLTHV